MDPQLQVELQTKIFPLLITAGVTCCYLFGSRSGHDYRPDSDLDLAVIFANFDPSVHNLEKEIELQEAVSELLFPLPVDLIFLQKAPVYLQFEVISKGRVIYCTDDNFRTDFEDLVLRNYLDFKPFLDRYYRDLCEDFLHQGFLRHS